METTKLRVYEADLESKPIDVHFLPFKLEYDGPANVSTYFIVEKLTTRDADADHNTLVAAFRGRRLLGETLELPKGSAGYIVSENFEFDDQEEEDSNEGCASQGRRFLEVQGRFTQVTHWDHDVRPSRSEGIVPKWLETLNIARAVHGSEDVHSIQ